MRRFGLLHHRITAIGEPVALFGLAAPGQPGTACGDEDFGQPVQSIFIALFQLKLHLGQNLFCSTGAQDAAIGQVAGEANMRERNSIEKAAMHAAST